MFATKRKIWEIYKYYFPEIEFSYNQIYRDPERPEEVRCLEYTWHSVSANDLFLPHLKFEAVEKPIELFNFRPKVACHDIDQKKQFRVDYLNKHYLEPGGGNKDNYELQLGYDLFLNQQFHPNSLPSDFKRRLGEIYILCLTESRNLESFGNFRYKLRFTSKITEPFIQLIKVKYEEDIEVQNFKRLKKELNKKFQLSPTLLLPHFYAPFIKRERFRSDQEYRFLFDLYKTLENNHESNNQSRSNIEEPEDKFLKMINRLQSHLEIPLDNPLFKIEVLDKVDMNNLQS